MLILKIIGITIGVLIGVLIIGSLVIYIKSKVPRSSYRKLSYWTGFLVLIIPLGVILNYWRGLLLLGVVLTLFTLFIITTVIIVSIVTTLLLIPAGLVIWVYETYLPEKYTDWIERELFAVTMLLVTLAVMAYTVVILEPAVITPLAVVTDNIAENVTNWLYPEIDYSSL